MNSRFGFRVRFDHKTKVNLFEENSRQMRIYRGYWLYYKADQARFAKRISQLDKVISPILSEEHREKISQYIFIQRLVQLKYGD